VGAGKPPPWLALLCMISSGAVAEACFGPYERRAAACLRSHSVSAALEICPAARAQAFTTSDGQMSTSSKVRPSVERPTSEFLFAMSIHPWPQGFGS